MIRVGSEPSGQTDLKRLLSAAVLAAGFVPMAEIRTVTTLRRKRDEISASIRLYEKKLEQARADLAHVTAAISLHLLGFKGCLMASASFSHSAAISR
jgi:predicted aconitase